MALIRATTLRDGNRNLWRPPVNPINLRRKRINCNLWFESVIYAGNTVNYTYYRMLSYIKVQLRSAENKLILWTFLAVIETYTSSVQFALYVFNIQQTVAKTTTVRRNTSKDIEYELGHVCEGKIYLANVSSLLSNSDEKRFSGTIKKFAIRRYSNAQRKRESVAKIRTLLISQTTGE